MKNKMLSFTAVAFCFSFSLFGASQYERFQHHLDVAEKKIAQAKEKQITHEREVLIAKRESLDAGIQQAIVALTNSMLESKTEAIASNIQQDPLLDEHTAEMTEGESIE